MIRIPTDVDTVELTLAGRSVKLTNLNKPFWPELGLVKRDLLQYYADVAPVLLPHLRDRAMVMKRYPHGAGGEFFFMKHAPEHRPDWLTLCSIEHASANVVDFPVIDDLAALLWVVNLGCIDLNQWYARCDDVDRPDYLHFDLDPTPGAEFQHVLRAALIVRDVLETMGADCYAKTSGSKGMHLYVPIERGPNQKEVWTLAKWLAKLLARQMPELLTGEYRIAQRPAGRILVDYNQNAWGRTLASVYSVRPTPWATVSTPVTWDEVRKGFRIQDFHIGNVPDRIHRLGDCWKPLLETRNRFVLEDWFDAAATA
jgi:bifunctional non-homologous end joining protein LigD